MAGTKIVDLPALGRNLASTDLFELSLAGGTGSRKITGQEILNSTGITIGTTAITSGTVGRVLFEGTGNVVSESANLFWDNTNGRLGIGTSSPSQDVSIVRSNNGNTALFLTNANTGSLAVASLNAVSNTTISALFATSSTHANYGVYGASASVLYSTKILSLVSDNSTLSEIRFGTGTPPTERMRIAATTGNLLINTTTDAGFKVDINGTARVNTLTIGLGGGSVATNTAIGFQGLNANTTGTANTALGYTALLVNTTGAANTAIGFNSLNSTNGTNNSGLGNSSLRHLSSGSLNTALGAEAGRYISDGVTNLTNCDNSVFLGMSARPLANSQTNQIVIGHNAIGAGNNTATIGNTSIVDTILRGRINLQQYATGSRPTYVKGALIYDSTLSKLVVGGASDWEVVTSV